jgi:hypothetical protein
VLLISNALKPDNILARDRVEAMAKRMSHDVVGHHPIMPGVSKTAQAFVATHWLEDSLHVPMMTILSCLCKTLTPGGLTSLPE